MTDRDIQTVEALFAAFRRGDVEAMGELTHREAEFVNPEYAIESGTRHGRDEIGRAVRRLLEFFDAVEAESIDRTPDGRILVAVRVRTHGVAGGRGIESQTATIFTVRDGLIVRYEWFRTPAEGRAAAGMPSA